MKRAWFEVVENFGMKFGLDWIGCLTTAIVDDDDGDDG